MRARYVVLEGIDGAGTTTLRQKLADALQAHGVRCQLAAQPSQKGAGAEARRYLSEALVHEHERAALALCFAADRLALRRQFEASLERGDWVLCDRSVLSSLVYQGSELDEGWVQQINRYALPADLTFLLDLPASTAWQRIASRGGARERFEVPELLHKLRQRYLDSAEALGSPVLTLDACQSPDEVCRHALEALRNRGWLMP